MNWEALEVTFWVTGCLLEATVEISMDKTHHLFVAKLLILGDTLYSDLCKSQVFVVFNGHTVTI